MLGIRVLGFVVLSFSVSRFLVLGVWGVRVLGFWGLGLFLGLSFQDFEDFRRLRGLGFLGSFRLQDWINVRDPLYFLGYGIPYMYVKSILFSS